jgi:hypothetical protein
MRSHVEAGHAAVRIGTYNKRSGISPRTEQAGDCHRPPHNPPTAEGNIMQNEAQAIPAIGLDSVESSKIHAIGHDPETQTLAIQFKNFKTGEGGSIYHYANFTADQFEAFKSAESIGKHFGLHIQKAVEAHPYVKVA